MSLRTLNPRPQIPLSSLVMELKSVSEQIIPCLTELKELRLILFDAAKSPYIKLTLLGSTVSKKCS